MRAGLSTTLERGIAATALMSVSFAARPGLAPPPKIVAFNTARRVGVTPEDLPPLVRNGYWIAAHLAFGTVLTAVHRLLPGRRRGIEYGIAAWVANYVLALPALHIYPTPARDDTVRTAAGLAGHVVFGAALRSLSRR